MLASDAPAAPETAHYSGLFDVRAPSHQIDDALYSPHTHARRSPCIAQFADVNAFLTFAATQHTYTLEHLQGRPRVAQILEAAKAGHVPVRLVSSTSSFPRPPNPPVVASCWVWQAVVLSRHIHLVVYRSFRKKSSRRTPARCVRLRPSCHLFLRHTSRYVVRFSYRPDFLPHCLSSARQVASWVTRVAPRHDLRSTPTRLLQRLCPAVERCNATAPFDPAFFVLPPLCLQSAQLAASPVVEPPF